MPSDQVIHDVLVESCGMCTFWDKNGRPCGGEEYSNLIAKTFVDGYPRLNKKVKALLKLKQ